MPAHRVPCSLHPSNNDPAAELVLGQRERWSVFRVRGGFVGVDVNGQAIVDLFPTKEAAADAVRVAQ